MKKVTEICNYKIILAQEQIDKSAPNGIRKRQFKMQTIKDGRSIGCSYFLDNIDRNIAFRAQEKLIKAALLEEQSLNSFVKSLYYFDRVNSSIDIASILELEHSYLCKAIKHFIKDARCSKVEYLLSRLQTINLISWLPENNNTRLIEVKKIISDLLNI